MFGVSLPELLLVLVVILVVFGPERMGDMARTLGKISGSLRKSTDALRREFYNSVYTPADDLKSSLGDTGSELRTIGAEVADDIKSGLQPVVEDLPEHLLSTCEEQAGAEAEQRQREQAAAEGADEEEKKQ